MIAEYRRAQGAYNAALEIDEDHPDLSRLADEEDVALEALCAHPVASIDDVRAKSAALLEHVKYFALPEDCYTALLRSFAA
ncbi:hypothetical protein CCR94_10610 [Rhodoblastus sphagnicola]|uniref:Uncharacterized protein n=2 Tax=Rhodoblastus sphagnicola TaxID=333368 RepID=A0A2S6N8P6_9HYPH|nr:hypothetical protein CCR94_10610 [Rhodoblastus sphagnicola]